MVLARSFKPFAWSTRAAHYIGNFPAVLDPTSNLLTLKLRRSINIPCFLGISFKAGSVIPMIYLIFQFLTLLYLHLVLYGITKVNELDKFVILILLFPVYISLIAQTVFLLNFEEITHNFNSIMILDVKMCKFKLNYETLLVIKRYI
jgi:hypothetical protein